MPHKLVWILGILAIPLVAFGKLAHISLAELEKLSSLVVVAKITSVDLIEGVKIATAEVESVHRGVINSRKIHFLAEPTWTCDASGAVLGETVLLYLHRRSSRSSEVANRTVSSLRNPSTGLKDFSKPFTYFAQKGETLYTISHSGCGRLPLEKLGDAWFTDATYSPYRKQWSMGLNDLPRYAQVAVVSKERGRIALRSLLADASKTR
jgi:hypothetical protein